ncbi:MAG: Slp family lipoprotein [Nitrospirae bacterium]|nr:Slp family lipoprotein [Nitrospirota bacterium]
MKKYLIIISVLSTFLLSCAPVLREELMRSGIYDFQLKEIKENPVFNTGKLFIFGGIIVKTTVTKEGSLIEAIYVPVDPRGYLRDYYSLTDGRFLAVFRGKELLDPLIFKEKREITLAGEFVEMRKGMIGEMEYSYPLFEIKEVYLWPELEQYNYYYPPPYPPGHYRYRPYDPWWYDPWWRHRYYRW